MNIIGAGMSGCIAALMIPEAKVFEAGNSPEHNHQAVLRFRSDEVSKVTGIPFKKVTVHKSIYSDGIHHNVCNPLLANLYSQKVIHGIFDRSIWKLDTVERFIAPGDFHKQMLDKIAHKTEFNFIVDDLTEFGTEPVINTAPMPVIAKIMGRDVSGIDFNYESISSYRCKLLNTNVYQTVYFPDPSTPVYRVTITGDDLIIESKGTVKPSDVGMIEEAFGIAIPCDGLEQQVHKYGKISPINEAVRKNFIYEATRNFQVYSLGRFAVWKNLLLDDVVDDVSQITRIMTKSPYELTRG